MKTALGRTSPRHYGRDVRSTDEGGGDGSLAEVDDDPRLRFAMLSVYYASLGRQFEIRGAPSVLLPPQVRPLDLATALDQLSVSPLRLREALWLIARGVRAQGLPSERLERYPTEFTNCFQPGSLDQFRRLRREYHAGANVFAAALVACRDGFADQFDALTAVLAEETKQRPRGFSAVTDLMMGMSAPDYLGQVASSEERRDAAHKQVQRLESDVGLNLYDFVEELADAAAFEQFSRDYLLDPPPRRAPLTVFPVSSVIRQDTKTLQTNATVTTLVRGDFETLRRVVDPQSWSRSSDVIQVARYVSDAFDLRPVEQHLLPEVGAGFAGFRLLDEKAVLSWGEHNDQQGRFTNVLNIHHVVGDTGPEDPNRFVDVRFSLRRSIESAVLWDRRAGGLQLNQGYLKVRALGRDAWRVTSRKVIRFSDRTPSVGGQGWLDFGQLLNYLAPAALTWWVESETYSMGDTTPAGAGPPTATRSAPSEAVP